MRCQVTRRMRLGKPIDAAEIRGLPAALGDLRINEEMCLALGRSSKTASVKGINSIGLSELPLLYEAVLSWMVPNGFVLSGLEEEGGMPLCAIVVVQECRVRVTRSFGPDTTLSTIYAIPSVKSLWCTSTGSGYPAALPRR